jgi:hypothetical protein
MRTALPFRFTDFVSCHAKTAWWFFLVERKMSMNDNKQKAEKKPYVRPRNVNLSIKINQEERDMIERRMAQSGIGTIRAYIVKMAIDGRIIHVELESVREMVRLLSNATNNINQIAKKCNETGNIYTNDVAVLREHVEEIWGQTREILQKLANFSVT